MEPLMHSEHSAPLTRMVDVYTVNDTLWPCFRHARAMSTTVVLEDGSYSLIKLAQENRQLPAHRMDFRPIDTVKMAEACGVQALRTADPGVLAAAVSTAVAQNRSLVVGVPVNYADYKLLF